MATVSVGQATGHRWRSDGPGNDDGNGGIVTHRACTLCGALDMRREAYARDRRHMDYHRRTLQGELTGLTEPCLGVDRALPRRRPLREHPMIALGHLMLVAGIAALVGDPTALARALAYWRGERDRRRGVPGWRGHGDVVICVHRSLAPTAISGGLLVVGGGNGPCVEAVGIGAVGLSDAAAEVLGDLLLEATG